MQKELAKLRAHMNKIDNQIINFVEKRKAVVKKFKILKEKNSIPLIDKKREKQIICRLKKKSKLSKGFISKIYKLIFKETRKE